VSPGDVLTVTPPSFVVNTTQDAASSTSGKTSLRAAILAANAAAGNVTISFDPTVFATLQTITLTLGEIDLTNTKATETIVGPAAGVKVNGGGLSRVFGVDGGVTASLSRMTITGGKTTGAGGGLDNLGTATLVNCTVTGNSATDGGGIMNDGLATLTNCTVSGNSATQYGAGLFGNSGTTVLENCTVSGNSGALYGGGLSIGNFATDILTNCTVSGNSATFGAGLFVSAYFSFYGYGGAYYGAAALTNCTVSGNSSFAGGGLYNQGALNLGNTIVARNSASYGGPDAWGSVTSAGHNLVGATNGSVGWTGSDLTGTTASRLNPLLAPLGNYGAPTKTMPLLPGSPAIDAGASSGAPATDQRGKGRVGPVDIGAFESQGFTLTPLATSTPQTAGVGKAFTNPLTVTVKANNPVEPVNGGVVKFVVNPAANGASATLSTRSAGISGVTASVKATANNVAGTYTVLASASGVPSAATFVLTNQAATTAVTLKGRNVATANLVAAADRVEFLPVGHSTDIPGKVNDGGPVFAIAVDVGANAELSGNDSIVYDIDSGQFIPIPGPLLSCSIGLRQIGTTGQH
jgi:CSLREA domain-containing protein